MYFKIYFYKFFLLKYIFLVDAKYELQVTYINDIKYESK